MARDTLYEASPALWIGKSGWKDWELKEILLQERLGFTAKLQ